MLKLGSEGVDDALPPLEETRLLADEDDADEDDARTKLDVGRLGTVVAEALLLGDDNESLVLEGKNGVPDVALEVELENIGVEDGTGGP
jgi:hypothetical protein